LAGGVPDGDDTAATLLALHHLGCDKHHRIASGVRWLVDLQNRDGGIPTFCRGYGKLPFDQSSPDLTAHALRAWSIWRKVLPDALGAQVDKAQDRALRYLLHTQRSDGSWVPLWFGNQQDSELQNPLYGTSRVLKATDVSGDSEWREAAKRGARWLLYTQSLEGGWGGAESIRPTIEETALAIDGLCAYAQHSGGDSDITAAIAYGAAWLAEATEEGTRYPAAPIGLYFAKLWYSEKLYPLVFATAALEKALPYCQVEWTKV
jgi:squalene-hopene/tetraprenyl-beta-curcumene cyclase